MANRREERETTRRRADKGRARVGCPLLVEKASENAIDDAPWDLDSKC